MEIYLLRHGIAVTTHAKIASNAERPLSKKGSERMSKGAKGLLSLGVSFDRILTSPLLRAQQTAQVVAEVLKMGEQLEEIRELAPEGSAEGLIGRLAAYQGKKGLLLVGHQPLLGETASLLLSKGKKIELKLKKGGICCIEVDRLPPEKPGILHWMLTPKQLRSLAES